MEDSIPRTAVFCTEDIPLKTLESLIERSEAYHFKVHRDELETSDYLVLMTSEDLSSIHRGMSSPVQPFTSPFIGQTIDEIAQWFRANIYSKDLEGYQSFSIIILESEAVEKEICTVVSFFDEPYETVRCDFSLALSVVNRVNTGRSLDDTGVSCFKNSGVAATIENYEIALNRGMYLEGMEVKIDQGWRDFVDEWTRG